MLMLHLSHSVTQNHLRSYNFKVHLLIRWGNLLTLRSYQAQCTWFCSSVAAEWVQIPAPITAAGRAGWLQLSATLKDFLRKYEPALVVSRLDLWGCGRRTRRHRSGISEALFSAFTCLNPSPRSSTLRLLMISTSSAGIQAVIWFPLYNRMTAFNSRPPENFWTMNWLRPDENACLRWTSSVVVQQRIHYKTKL